MRRAHRCFEPPARRSGPDHRRTLNANLNANLNGALNEKKKRVELPQRDRSDLNASLNGDRDKGVWPVLRTIRVGDSGRLVQGPCAERRADSRATSTDAQRQRELCTLEECRGVGSLDRRQRELGFGADGACRRWAIRRC
ncbi:MAG: hypothetical protein M5T61_14175 [Acidimicrobiia bacterium]|nr:hypothetical protein [Acidimicrobiia bacterium]